MQSPPPRSRCCVPLSGHNPTDISFSPSYLPCKSAWLLSSLLELLLLVLPTSGDGQVLGGRMESPGWWCGPISRIRFSKQRVRCQAQIMAFPCQAKSFCAAPALCTPQCRDLLFLTYCTCWAVCKTVSQVAFWDPVLIIAVLLRPPLKHGAERQGGSLRETEMQV